MYRCSRSGGSCHGREVIFLPHAAVSSPTYKTTVITRPFFTFMYKKCMSCFSYKAVEDNNQCFLYLFNIRHSAAIRENDRHKAVFIIIHASNKSISGIKVKQWVRK